MPGKTEVSFEQWYHEVQCVKDHYPELVVHESIVRFLKGVVADIAWYMGPTASVAEILQKLTVIFGTVVSFNVLMHNFYKVTQGNHEKVPYFATRLEGTLNQIWLKCPRRIADCKVACHLKDWLLHGVCKHISDSNRYLHSNPGASSGGDTQQGANVLCLITEVKQSWAQLIHGWVTVLPALLHSVIGD